MEMENVTIIRVLGATLRLCEIELTDQTTRIKADLTFVSINCLMFFISNTLDQPADDCTNLIRLRLQKRDRCRNVEACFQMPHNVCPRLTIAPLKGSVERASPTRREMRESQDIRCLQGYTSKEELHRPPT